MSTKMTSAFGSRSLNKETHRAAQVNRQAVGGTDVTLRTFAQWLAVRTARLCWREAKMGRAALACPASHPEAASSANLG
jgi:hypothetical protein